MKKLILTIIIISIASLLILGCTNNHKQSIKSKNTNTHEITQEETKTIKQQNVAKPDISQENLDDLKSDLDNMQFDDINSLSE